MQNKMSVVKVKDDDKEVEMHAKFSCEKCMWKHAETCKFCPLLKEGKEK